MAARRTLVLAALGVIVAVVAIALATQGGDDTTATATSTTSSTARSSTAGLSPAPAPTSSMDAPDSSSTVVAPTTSTVPSENLPELENRGPHEELREIDGWLQSEVTSLEELRGNVVAVQFWTFGCHNCRATLPHMQALYERYGDRDFEIVGIHSPEFDREEDPGAVAEAADELGVTWPIALDTQKRTFFGWQGNRGFWPRIYLLDRDGNVRYDHVGEGRYDEIDAAVDALLDEQA